MVGQALHGGLRPVGSTFFVFSDYARPAIRLAALSSRRVFYSFTRTTPWVLAKIRQRTNQLSS